MPEYILAIDRYPGFMRVPTSQEEDLTNLMRLVSNRAGTGVGVTSGLQEQSRRRYGFCVSKVCPTAVPRLRDF